jgi:STE24 endopeptidase
MNLKNILFLLLLLQFVFSISLKYLNYVGDPSSETIDAVLKYFTTEDLARGTEYGQRGFGASIASKVFDILFIGILVFTLLGSRWEDYLKTKLKDRYYFLVLGFFISILIVRFLFYLPFSFYFGYVLEHRFGFSKMLLSDWIWFTTKSLLVGIGMGVFLSLLTAYTLKTFKKTWIYLIPLGSLLLGLLFSILFPVLITPIFYDFHPIAKGSLASKIETLCESAQITVSEVYVIEESKYSGHTNAYFTGWGENRKIFLYDTLIKNHTEEEVISVLGHEIGHWKHNHVLLSLFANTIQVFLLCLLVYFLFPYLMKNGFDSLKELNAPSSWALVYLIVSLSSTLLNPLWNTMSRYEETQADQEALLITGDAKSFISTEIKLARDNQSRLNPHPFVVWYSYSHPKTIDRIKLAENYQTGNPR